MLLLPPLFGFSYFILDFPMRKKVAVMTLAVGYFIITAPVQIVTCAILTHLGSLALIPLFYLAFGPLVYVSWFVAFFSWGTSWSSAKKAVT